MTLNLNASSTPFHLGHRRWLDGLRGVAILMVLCFHLGFLPGGSLGVDLFFVLSGFLITILLTEEWQKQRTINLKQFYLRRLLRLFPAFFSLLLICALSSLMLSSAEEAALRRKEVAVAACYVANWPELHHTSMPLLGHTWSLSVEEQFYLIWPLLLYGMFRGQLSRRTILWVVGGGILTSASLRIFLYSLHRAQGPEKIANIMRLYMGLDTRADALLVGCLLGLLVSWDMLPKSRRFVAWSGVAAIASMAGLGYLAWNRCLDHSQYYHGLFTVAALMVAAIILRNLEAPLAVVTPVLEWSPLVGIGRISYGLYLFHIPIISWLTPPESALDPAARSVLAVALTLAAALASFYCIERPCLRLRERFRSKIVPALSANDVSATQSARRENAAA